MSNNSNIARSEQLSNQYYKEIYGGDGESAKKIKQGDKVYIINLKEGCTLRPSGRVENTKKNSPASVKVEVVTSGYPEPTDVWSISFSQGFEKKNNTERYIRFQYDGNVANSSRRHLALVDYTSYPTVRMGGTSINKDWAKRINFKGRAYGGSVFTEELRYGTPYILSSEEALSNPKKRHRRIQMSSTSQDIIYEPRDAYSAAPGSEYWIFLPADEEYMGNQNIPILCRFARSFKGDYFDTNTGEIIEEMSKGRCGQRLLDACIGPMNNYCGNPNNTFNKKSNCYRWLKDNPRGMADNAIRRICKNDTYTDTRECGCVGPIETMDTSTTPDKNSIALDWGCYGATCVNNTSAWKLEQQEKTKCPTGALCVMTNIKTEGGGKITYGQKCSANTTPPRDIDDLDDDDDPNNIPLPPYFDDDEDDEPNYILYIGLGIGAISLIGIITFLLLRRNRKKEETNQQNQYPPASVYNPPGSVYNPPGSVYNPPGSVYNPYTPY